MLELELSWVWKIGSRSLTTFCCVAIQQKTRFVQALAWQFSRYLKETSPIIIALSHQIATMPPLDDPARTRLAHRAPETTIYTRSLLS
jgi:hypothetical protein